MWDDATTRIAHHRLLNSVTDNEPGLGPRPADAVESGRWQGLMIRLLEDRLWLADHPAPSISALIMPTPTEVVDRRQELQQLLAAAPANQRQFIDRLVHSRLDPTEMHQYLTAATAAQDDRRTWILTNWPHLVELEQITQLIAAQQPLAHWPNAQPDQVRDVLEQLRQLAPSLDAREERTLAELDRPEAANDPILELETRRSHLRQLAARTTSPIEREAIETELADLNDRLRSARREQVVQQTFDRYLPTAIDEARTTRIATLAHDTLTAQPTWVVDHIRQLHDNHQLSSRDVAELATQIIQAAAHHDLHGQLPAIWPATPTPTMEVAQPSIELG